MKRWSARIEGDPSLIAALSTQVHDHGLTIRSDVVGTLLYSSDLDGVDDEWQAWVFYTNLISAINGIVSIRTGLVRGIKFSNTLFVEENGSRHLIAKDVETYAVVSRMNVVHAGERLSELTRVALDNDRLFKALCLLKTRNNDWFNLFKIYELLIEDFRVGKQQKKEVEKTIEANGWCASGALELFRRTANSVEDGRHAADKEPPPAQPMLLATAEAMLRKLLDEWLRSYSAGGGLTPITP